MGMSRDPRPLVEPVFVKDTFVSDLGRVDILGENVRFVLFTEQFPEEGEPAARVVECKIVMAKAAVLPALARVLFALGLTAVPPDVGSPFLTRMQ